MRERLVVRKQGRLRERVGDRELEEVRVRLECCWEEIYMNGVTSCSREIDLLKKSLYMRGNAILGSC